jgi:hypothetical protein
MVKMLHPLHGAVDLDKRYAQVGGAKCRDCGTQLRPVLITPTHLKDYRNPHIARSWYEASRELREAKRAIFVGYSMPDDDVEVVYLFKRGLANLEPQAITIVESAKGSTARLDRHPVGRRYRALFGDGVDWCPDGFERWIRQAASRGFEPGRPPPRRPGPTRS